MTMAIDQKSSRKPRQLTGRMVLYRLIAFFGVIAAMNAVMIYIALDTFPGLEVDSSYKVSQRYNKEIANAKAQAALNWNVDAAIERNGDGSAHIRVLAEDKTGAVITGESVTVKLHRPAITAADQDLILSERSAGEYVANLSNLGAGHWNVVVEIADPSDKSFPIFRSKNKIFFAE
ncbi:FixH [Pseudovibrio axinellae]|uniref:FixH n=1 Tax=Pseudovibrio axinellae TaxID=989403 RepID=A0A165YLD8_9HYPH|nr:FixH family protein [Pseudovibrio axinellae]KZL18950.1 FixH [Pseudovibrio axinellae]SEP86546.1 Nitrogen fixation protein FixH [Pseudovibrio axinellae]